MKNALYSIVFVAILSGCAKVTHEAVPCEYASPPAPYVLDILIQPGGYGTAIVTNSRFDSVLFTGPNNFKSTSKSGSLFLDFSLTTNYGKYTATSVFGGCKSIPYTFNVVDSFTGTPTCTIAPSDSNKLVGSNNITYRFWTAGLNNSTPFSCTYNNSHIEATTIGYPYKIDISIPNQPASGSYCELVSNCPTVYGNAYVTLASAFDNSLIYVSKRGKIYFNTIGSGNYITFCGCTFTDIANGNTFTWTGNLQYY